MPQDHGLHPPFANHRLPSVEYKGQVDWDNRRNDLKVVIHKMYKFEEVVQVTDDTETNDTIWETID